MNRYGKRCVLYPRVSTEMQVDGYSLEGQKNMLTRFADREEMIIVDTYEDAGKSGKSIEGRPAFQKMLRDIEDGLDIDYILVYKLSRFGRNAADILNSLELVQSYGVNLICIEEGIDSSQTSGKLLISVLSAVAEIERENIIEQTMNGRREKARQGGWNGGFAPYGYTLEDNKLMIEETEAVAIRKIFELYTSSEIGLGGIANQLNLQGIRKIPRQNGTLEDWTGHFIKLILDNPVYCGKIAYGRRTKEKVKGTKNDYQMKRNDDYILTEGQHKGIVSEEVWEKAHAKRLRTGVKQPSKIGRDRVHLLSGLLKCPVCGSPMYTNKHAWTNKDGTYKEIYYYVCSRNRMVRGKHCEYKAMLKKTDIEPMVIEAIREIVRNEEYAQAIKKRIGVQIDTKAVDKELEGYQAKLKEVDLNKTRLEREIDSLPADAKYRERKLHDMTLRLDSLYDVIVELEEKIEDARLRRDAIKQQAITLENIYKIMVNFDCVYNIINDEEKRNVVTALIKEIEIYRNDESEYPLKRIGLNFPVFKDGGEVTELLWDKGNTVETVVLLSHKKPDSVINVKVEFGEGEGKIPLDNIEKRAESYKPKERVTYKMIKEYIEAKHGFKVHTAYIAEVKRDLGLPMYDNHFVVNSVSFLDGKHYHDNKANLRLLRQRSDELCREYALSVIEHPSGKKKPYALYQAEKNGMPTRDNVARQAVDEAISKSFTLKDFDRQMAEMGYRVSFDPNRKYWTIIGKGWERPKRLYKLGEDYTNERITERIRENSYAVKFSRFAEPQKTVQVFRVKGSLKNAKKIGGLRGLYLHYCYRLGILPKSRKQNYARLHYLLKDDLMKMEAISQETRLLCRNRIDTVEQLLSYKGSLETEMSELTEQRKELYSKSRKSGGEEKEAVKARLTEITERMKFLRKEVRLCGGIEARNDTLKEKLTTIRADEQQGKELMTNEHRRRSGRTNRPNELGGL